ncbi:DUF2637 domain-containing protein [Frankia sp. AgB1.9]|uniref:DUF2637 domain-containing protein n=1 Tax=unclassified Frankia TaxID=2632575 RepID=UPI001934A36F|nr:MULTISPECIES: DUF2637 domain-containing protein [unclassified Frankia]MBL7487445.1 DUF2637 domain-containing protein [Frankia sp. AgW1.1]MBL7551037.1 DUF2637 domain-containing protein [Frankia sp. AgB1.9]MBL7618818.1 DUF2637 domain-containing protein [Frankia sp. AgB1.8]
MGWAAQSAPDVGTGGPSRTRPRRWRDGDSWIRLATVLAVLAVAVIAASVSYRHIRGVALDHGEDPTAAAIIPISVDGLIVAASMTLLADSRAGRRRNWLPYTLLALSSAASVAANVMHAQPDLAARVISAWPSAALIGAYELLMGQIRAATRSSVPEGQAGRRHPAVAVGPGLGAPGVPTPGPAGFTAAASPEPQGVRGDRSQGPRPMPGDELDGANPLGVHTAAGPDGAAQSVAASTGNADMTFGPVPVLRAGTKRAALIALLASVAPDDPRSDYALARDLAPIVDLHAGTARRYIAQVRRPVAGLRLSA